MTAALAREISARGMNVIIVDDGSVVPLDVGPLRGVRVIRHDVPRGLGAAITSGVDAATAFGYEVFATIDGDGQHHVEDLEKVVAGLAEAEFVLGDRFTGRAHAIPTSKLASNYVGACVFNLAFGTDLRDIACGLRAFRRSVMPKESQAGYGGVFDLLVSTVTSGQRVTSRPVSVEYPIDQVWTTRRPEILGLVAAFAAVADRLPAKALDRLTYASEQLERRSSFVFDIAGTAAHFHSLDDGSHYLVQIEPTILNRYYAGSAP